MLLYVNIFQFLAYVRMAFLLNLSRNLPKTLLDKSWPESPASLKDVSINNKCVLQAIRKML